MHATYTVPVVLLFGIFLGGYALGWIMASLRQRSTLGFKLGEASPDSLGALATSIARTSTSRAIRLKCTCGSVWNFRGPNDSSGSDQPVLPDGDSYTCPKCGRAIDLRPMREMLKNMKGIAQ
jgi:hypothetical protein